MSKLAENQSDATTVEHWLERYAAGYSNLRTSERLAIAHFTLLWSFFEAKVMNRHASVPSIAAWVDQWAAFGAPRKADFERPLVYFRERYWRDGSFTPLFDGLNFRRSDRKPFVKSVLMNERQEAGDVVLALLLIVFRLRNNLFHGEKWLYEIQGQERNFESANQILITILEL